MILELFAKGSVQRLQDAMPDFQYGEEQAMVIFGQVVDAVEHVHSCGYIHSDIKPNNILVSRCGAVKSADFSYSVRICGDACYVGGCKAFMAPEVIAPSLIQRDAIFTDFDATIDVYSLGVTLYDLVVGCTPYAFVNLKLPSGDDGDSTASASKTVTQTTHVTSLSRKQRWIWKTIIPPPPWPPVLRQASVDLQAALTT